MTPIRKRIIAEARTWIGTPYRHQAALKGHGCDCLGLVRGLCAFLDLDEAAPVPSYPRDWFAPGEETLLAAARHHLVPFETARPGDVLVFRMRRGAAARHCALLSGEARMIHAVSGRRVCEVAYTPWWARHLAGAFAFPGTDG